MDYDARAHARLFAKLVSGENDCIEFAGATNHKGYGAFTYRSKTTNAHVVAYMICVADIPDGLSVLHTCDNRLCVNPEHLFLGTADDNSKDMVNKERQSRGEDRPMAKLTEDDVRQIRKLCAVENASFPNIANAFNVSRAAIHKIYRRSSWKHVQDLEG